MKLKYEMPAVEMQRVVLEQVIAASQKIEQGGSVTDKWVGGEEDLNGDVTLQ